MKIFLKSLFLFFFVLLFSGCNDLKEQNEEFKKEISKRQNNSYEYFQSTNEKIDNTFDKKETSNHSVSEKIAAILKGDSDKKEQNKEDLEKLISHIPYTEFLSILLKEFDSWQKIKPSLHRGRS